MLVVLVAACLPVTAWASGCGPATAPRLTVLATPLAPSYRHGLTRAQIGTLGGAGHAAGRSHLGLTRSETAISVKPMVAFYRQPDGTVCGALQQVEVDWRMAALQVDIAAEYREGSCPYGEILRHENQHVAIAQRGFAAVERALRLDMPDQVRRFQPFVLRSSQQQATAEVASRLLAMAKLIVDRHERETHRENAAIDTPESYRQVGARCRDW